MKIFRLGLGVGYIFGGFFDAVEDLVVEDFGALVHWVLGAACLYLLDGTVLHWFEILRPSFDDGVPALCLSEGVLFLIWLRMSLAIGCFKVLQSLCFISFLRWRMLLLEIDFNILIEVLLTKILNTFFYAFFAGVNKTLDLLDDLAYLPITWEESILGVGKHEK